MPPSVGDIVILLVGLVSVWLGIFGAHANRTAASSRDEHLHQRWSPAEVRLWLIGWAMGGLGFVCLGVSTLRYAKGPYVSVPASAPVIDKVVWVLAQVGAAGCFVTLFAWMMLRPRQERRSHPEDV
jgi:hypothetical protein